MKNILLEARDAHVTGVLQIQEVPLAHTIHYWHNTKDTISWMCEIRQAGSYFVKLCYSLGDTLTGGVIQISVTEQDILFNTLPTENWNDFREFEAGVLNIKTTGTISVVLRGHTMPVSKNSALPDIHWLALVRVD